MGPDAAREGDGPLHVSIVAHPPERRRRPGTVAACGCCCCCCCCLHSLGGIVGAAMGSVKTTAPAPYRPRVPSSKSADILAEEPRSGGQAIAIYWLTLLGLVLATAILVGATAGGGEAGVIAVLLVALGLPLLQLGASLVAWFIVLLGPVRDKGAAAERIGKITLAAFLWALAGVLIMIPLAFALGAIF